MLPVLPSGSLAIPRHAVLLVLHLSTSMCCRSERAIRAPSFFGAHDPLSRCEKNTVIPAPQHPPCNHFSSTSGDSVAALNASFKTRKMENKLLTKEAFWFGLWFRDWSS